jgi:hypothetical protein
MHLIRHDEISAVSDDRRRRVRDASVMSSAARARQAMQLGAP